MNNTDYRLEKAIAFASQRHKGATRKGKDTPYILHPLETVTILAAMDADINLLMAGVLHDTVEDTDATLQDILDNFGEDVAELVASHSEDKSKSWQERKQHTIDELQTADIRHKMLVIADKIANLRDMAKDYRTVGENLWDRFNASKEYIAWYYNGIVDGLAELQRCENTRDAYWELTNLYKDLFVSFYIDEARGRIYQVSCDINYEGWMFSRQNPMWIPFNGPIPETAIKVPRQYAERIEDNWLEN